MDPRGIKMLSHHGSLEGMNDGDLGEKGKRTTLDVDGGIF